MKTGFEGLDAPQEGEEVMPHTRGGLLPILSCDAESIRKGAGSSRSKALTMRSPLTS